MPLGRHRLLRDEIRCAWCTPAPERTPGRRDSAVNSAAVKNKGRSSCLEWLTDTRVLARREALPGRMGCLDASATLREVRRADEECLHIRGRGGFSVHAAGWWQQFGPTFVAPAALAATMWYSTHVLRAVDSGSAVWHGVHSHRVRDRVVSFGSRRRCSSVSRLYALLNIHLITFVILPDTPRLRALRPQGMKVVTPPWRRMPRLSAPHRLPYGCSVPSLACVGAQRTFTSTTCVNLCDPHPRRLSACVQR